MTIEELINFDNEFDFDFVEHDYDAELEQLKRDPTGAPNPKRQRLDRSMDAADTSTRTTVTLLPGQEVVTLCSPQVFYSLGRQYPKRLSKPPVCISFTEKQVAFFRSLFEKYTASIEDAVFSAMQRGLCDQHMNFDFEDFKAPHSLQIGRPYICQEIFINELKRSDGKGAFPGYYAKLFGVSHFLMRNKRFTVRFFW